MRIGTFEPGTEVLLEGKRYRIHKVVGVEGVLLIDEGSGSLRTADPQALDFINPGNALPRGRGIDLADVPEEQWMEAKRRRDLVAPLAEQSPCPAHLAAEVARELGVGIRQVYNLIKLYRQRNGVVTAFLKGGKGRSRRKRLSPVVERLIAERAGFYLSRQRPSMAEFVADVRGFAAKAGETTLPSYKAIRARMLELDPALIAGKRHGTGARRKVTLVTGSYPEVKAPWEVVQIDQTPCDVMIVDEVHRKAIGRPTLSVAIDLYSRCIVGFAVTLKEASGITVALCLTHAVLDKTEWLAQRRLDLSYPVWGKPEALAYDRGAEYRGNGFRRGLEQYGITPKIRPPGAPHLHGCIERVIGTLMKRVHSLPGTTFSTIDERGEYKSEELACLTRTELERIVVRIICDIYNRSVHETIQDRPLDRYLAYFRSPPEASAAIPPRVEDRRRFMIDFLPYEERHLTRTGFDLFRVEYSAASLLPLVRAGLGRSGPRYIVRYDPRDLSRVYVLDPETNDYLEVGYRHSSRPPITLRESEQARARLARLKSDRIREAGIFETVLEIRRELEAAAERSRTARRAVQRRKDAQAGVAADRELRGEPPVGADFSPPASPPGVVLPRISPGDRFDDIDEVFR